MRAAKKPHFNVNKFLATVDGGRTYRTAVKIKPSSGKETWRGFGLLHTGRQGQGHCPFRSGEGSGCRYPWQRRLFRGGLFEWSATAFGVCRGNGGQRNIVLHN